METELSKFVWKLKRQGKPYEINWKIIANPPKSTDPHRCCLCLEEKIRIMTFKNNRLLNKRNEYLNACRHTPQN